MEQPFAKGSMRYVARGIYTSGKRKNQACVIKWFRSGHVASNTFFRQDIKAVAKALDIIKKFNRDGIINQHIRLNIPDVWVFGTEAGFLAGKKVLVEPYIENFGKCTFSLSAHIVVLYVLNIANGKSSHACCRELEHWMEH